MKKTDDLNRAQCEDPKRQQHVKIRSNPQARSCDSFFVLKANGTSIYGKNSDRPQDEIQLVRYFPRQKRESPSETVCMTHGLQVAQVEETFAVILSQPAWMYGAEMGANEWGVVIGNEAIFSRDTEKLAAKLNPRETLLGMDYVRLGLERGKSARHALEVITKLIEKYGQGGPCDLHDDTWSYDNSFLIVDHKEGYVLETTGKWWIAERITIENGKKVAFRNISNRISIGSKYHLIADGLLKYAKDQGYWDGVSPFNFSKAFSENPSEVLPQHMLSPFSREGRGHNLLSDYAVLDSFSPKEMMNLVLRDHEGDLCLHGPFASTSSMVSFLGGPSETVHWFTATSFPCLSFYKPFIFPSPDLHMQNLFSVEGDEDQSLWTQHSQKHKNPFVQRKLRQLELKYLELAKQVMSLPSNEKYFLFREAIREELESYQQDQNQT